MSSSRKGTQQAHGKESKKEALDEKENKGTLKNIIEQEKIDQEKCFLRQTALIEEQERSIRSQNEIIAKLKKSIEDQEGVFKEYGSNFDHSKSIQNKKKDLDNQKNEIQRPMNSTESSGGEKKELENTINDIIGILEKQEEIIGKEKLLFEEQKRNIEEQTKNFKEQKRNIIEQTRNIDEQNKNIEKQKERIELQNIFLEDLRKIINDLMTKKIGDGKEASFKSTDIQGLEKIIREMKEKLDDQLDLLKKLLKIKKESCADNIKVGITGMIAGTMMIIAALLVSWCDITDEDNVCERKRALKNLGIDFSCRHQEVKNESSDVLIMGVASFITDFIILVICMIILSVSPKHRNTGVFIVNISFVVEAVLFFSILFWGYSNISGFSASPKTMDYGPLKQEMINSLTQNYKSDDLSSSDIISNNWNTFFITYDCCAVNQVIGTTNDFDTTPWCTTSGSCQQTNSQIPKTCCKDVTKDDYVNASTSCHATVNDGTYKKGCLSRIKSLSDVAIQEYDIKALMTYVFTLAIIKVAACFLNLVMAIMYCACRKRDKKTNNQTAPETSSESD